MKHIHEFRDPIHTFISLRTDERRIIDSRPFQRLRNIHQLAFTYLLYPAATHKRFEHSLGVMHLASRIFDVVVARGNILHESVRNIIPDEEGRDYWKSVLRAAALCHDIGHLPFSHAAEKALLPKNYNHERLSIELIASPEMESIWKAMTPPLRSSDIIKLAVGPAKADMQMTTWENILSEIIIGDAFGADRMDYLLRDAYHCGVEYGKFDHNRLIGTLRILPSHHEGSDQPALGLEEGGLKSSEGLMIARHFMYAQVYLHHIRRVYDIHLLEFLKKWLSGGRFSTDLREHLKITDVEVLTAIRKAAASPSSPNHTLAKRIECRKHFHRLYSSMPAKGQVLKPGKKLAEAAAKEFGAANIRYDQYVAKDSAAPNFPVLRYDGGIVSSLRLSSLLSKLPGIAIETVYCDESIVEEAETWREKKVKILLKSSKSKNKNRRK